MKLISAVPTNIITGALGVGKTTFIQRLLQSKPENERWAVLINEFGEVGIDAAMLQSTELPKSSDTNAKSLFIKEVPGGCMCCASGLPMQIALNQLLAIAKPHRLLIEPTGLGHPKEVIQVLKSEHYQQVLKLESTLCLVDPRKLANKRWREHQTFQDQFEVAQHILVTKADLSSANDEDNLKVYLQGLGLSGTPLHYAYKDTDLVDMSLLKSSSTAPEAALQGTKKQLESTKLSLAIDQIKVGMQATSKNLVDVEESHHDTLNSDINHIQRNEKETEGFYSQGWIWPADKWFDFDSVMTLVDNLQVIRLKAVMITEKGIYSFNIIDGETTMNELDEAYDSRLEYIAESRDEADQAKAMVEQALCSEQ